MATFRNELKVHDIVVVNHEDYRHCGEVISRPIGNGGIMVRMVPGDPDTMQEVSVASLSVLNEKPNWVHYAEVSGNFGFPIDMLRYDFAAPVNFTFTGDDRHTTVYKPENAVWGERLVIAAASLYKQPRWTIDRWRSFCWGIKPLNDVKLEGVALAR